MLYTVAGSPNYGVAGYYQGRYGMYLPTPVNNIFSYMVISSKYGEVLDSDFCIHFKMKFGGTKSSYCVALQNQEILLILQDPENSNLITLAPSYSPWTRYLIISGYGAVLDGVWKEIIINRTSGLIRVFINGIIVGSCTNTKPIPVSFSISEGDSAHYLNGTFDDFVVVKGNSIYQANYTLNTTGYFLDPYKVYMGNEKKLLGYK